FGPSGDPDDAYGSTSTGTHSLLSGPRHALRGAISRISESNSPPILVDLSSTQGPWHSSSFTQRTTTMGTQRTRREFFGNVGRGMLVASVGFGTAFDMGLTPAWADEGGGDERLTFGGLEPLVSLMQETPVRNLVPVLVEKLRAGTELKQLVAAAALANARTFGGEDYVGFHTLMALAPAYHMAPDLPQARHGPPG